MRMKETHIDTNTILHISSIASVNGLYERIFYTISKYKIVQKVFVPCNSVAKGNYRLEKELADRDVELVTSVVGNPLSRLLFYPKAALNFDRLEKSFSLDKVKFTFAHSLFTDGVLAYKLFKKYKIPYTITVHSMDVNFFLKRVIFLRPLARKIIGSAEKIIFLNGAYPKRVLQYFEEGEKVREQLQEKTMLLPNGVDEYWINNIVASPKTLPNSKRIKCLFVGRLLKLKNLENIIKSILKLNEEGYEATFTIVGSPYDAMEIVTQYASQYPDKVKYLGHISDKEALRLLYKEHDIFVMPSFTESFGLVYIEAMTQGTPVVYSRDEGIYGIFEEGTVGFGPSPHSVKEIVEAIKDIASNYLTFSENCIEKAAIFSWDAIIPRYLEIGNEAAKLNGNKEEFMIPKIG